jgi:hypothetical protein
MLVSFLLVCYLTAVSVSRLIASNDKTINEFGAVGRIEIDLEKPKYSENTYFVACLPTTEFA